MRITYDANVDAAYVYLDAIAPGAAAKTHTCDVQSAGMINLDFDRDGRLLGIEVLNASRALPEATLRQAERIDEPVS